MLKQSQINKKRCRAQSECEGWMDEWLKADNFTRSFMPFQDFENSNWLWDNNGL